MDIDIISLDEPEADLGFMNNPRATKAYIVDLNLVRVPSRPRGEARVDAEALPPQPSTTAGWRTPSPFENPCGRPRPRSTQARPAPHEVRS